MSIYTDARSQPGRKGAAGATDRDLWLQEFGGLVIQAYDEAMDYGELRFVRQITQGKADSFPTIGKKRDATEHIPGELIVGGQIEGNERIITLDNMLVDSVFLADIDVLLSHFPLSEPYAHQIGQSLGSTNDKRIAIMHILASREASNVHQGQPAPAYYYHANLKTDGSKLEEAAQLSRQYILEQEMPDKPAVRLPWQQVLLLAKFAGVEGGPVTTGSGNRAAGTIGDLMGLSIKGTNHIPKTNITTGLAKYRGDFSTTVGHAGTRYAVGSLERRALKVVMKEQEDRLGTIIIGSQLNGHGILRPECSIEWRTDAIGGRASLTG